MKQSTIDKRLNVVIMLFIHQKQKPNKPTAK